MDDEWIVERHHELTWWPTPLPLTIRVVGAGVSSVSNEEWIRVEGSTLVVQAEESIGRELASEYKSEYPVGSLIYRNGALYLTTICSFNPRNRSLLPWFHEALLIQAAMALELAGQWMDIEGVQTVTPAHPSSGERSDVDDLVLIYGTEEFRAEINDEAARRFDIIRPMLREQFINGGFQLGYSNDEVDFFNLGFGPEDSDGALQQGAFDFAIGTTRGTRLETRFGPGLVILARVLPPGAGFNDEDVTLMTEALCDLAETGVFGYLSGAESTQGGSGLRAVIPHLTLAEWSNLSPVTFCDAITNAAWHVAAAAQVLRRDVLGINWP